SHAGAGRRAHAPRLPRLAPRRARTRTVSARSRRVDGARLAGNTGLRDPARALQPRTPMFQSATPIAFFQQQINILQSQMPGLLDGRLDSIHDARIATRRIREVLPLTHEWQRRHAADDLFERFKRAGRSLGKVRDADVRIELLRYLESRIPHAAPSLVLVRQRQERERLALMRGLLKRFERLGIGEELNRLSSGAAWRGSRFW